MKTGGLCVFFTLLTQPRMGLLHSDDPAPPVAGRLQQVQPESYLRTQAQDGAFLGDGAVLDRDAVLRT